MFFEFFTLPNMLTFPFLKPTNFNAEVQIFSRSLEASYEFVADK